MNPSGTGYILHYIVVSAAARSQEDVTDSVIMNPSGISYTLYHICQQEIVPNETEIDTPPNNTHLFFFLKKDKVSTGPKNK